MRKITFRILAFFFLVIGTNPVISQSNPSKLSPQQTSELVKRSTEILTLIKNKNYNKLSDHAHPDLGIRFSPSAYTDTLQDKILKKEDLKKPDKVFFWGYYDGTGDSILLNISKYMDHFVYPLDYLKVNKHSVNKIILSNNSTNNIQVIYKHDDFVEFHHPGGKEADGADWQSIRLVFRKKMNKLFLIGVISDRMIR